MSHEECPLKRGDRISHKLFGFGTVAGEPVAVVGPDTSTFKSVPRGWSVPVEWDDRRRAPGRMASDALDKVSSPHTKGVHYWHHQWKKLKQAYDEAHTKTGALLAESFRASPPFSYDAFAAQHAIEQKALNELVEFLRQDAAGEHE